MYMSPLAYFFSVLNVAIAACALNMFLRVILAEVLELMTMWQAQSVRWSCLSWAAERWHLSKE